MVVTSLQVVVMEWWRRAGKVVKTGACRWPRVAMVERQNCISIYKCLVPNWRLPAPPVALAAHSSEYTVRGLAA